MRVKYINHFWLTSYKFDLLGSVTLQKRNIYNSKVIPHMYKFFLDINNMATSMALNLYNRHFPIFCFHIVTPQSCTQG